MDWSIILGGALGLMGSALSSSSAKKAAEAQYLAASEATALQREMWQQGRADMAPWLQAGQWALGTPGYTYQPQYETVTRQEPVQPSFGDYVNYYRQTGQRLQPGQGGYRDVTEQRLLPAPINPATGQPYAPGEAVPATGLVGMVERGPGEFVESPSYQFVREEGLRGMERGASAMGGLRSGRLLRGAGRYAADLASTEYDNFLRRYYASLAPYETLAGYGLTTAGQLGGLGAQYAGMGTNALLQGGQAQAAGILGQAYPYSQLANWGATNLLNYGMYNQPQNALAQYQQTGPYSYYGGAGSIPYYQPPQPTYGGIYNPSSVW